MSNHDVSVTIISLLEQTIPCLTAAGCDNPRLDAELLLAHSLNKARSWLYLYPDHSPEAIQIETFLSAIARREQREPLAYITGHKEFFSLDFLVNKHVLIPRPETELLIETALLKTNEILNKTEHNKLTIVDVGTGSGCIAVSLAKNLPEALIFAVDISAQALSVAQYNAAQQQVSPQIIFLQADLLSTAPESVDMIVSNPPYISQADLVQTMPEVQAYEPTLALDGGMDGLQVIHPLLAQAKKKLRPGGYLLIEIGFDQGSEVLSLAKTYFPQAHSLIKKDLAALDRLLVLRNG